MQTSDAIRHMCESTGGGPVTVSKSMGKARTYISAMLSRGTVPRADTLSLIAQSCGYKLVLEGNGERIEIDPEPFANQVIVEYDPSAVEPRRG